MILTQEQLTSPECSEHFGRYKAALEEQGFMMGKEWYTEYILTQTLGELMSEASEKFIFAGWHGDWAQVVIEDVAAGQGVIDSGLLIAMRRIHSVLGWWADLDTFVQVPNDILNRQQTVYIPYVENFRDYKIIEKAGELEPALSN